MYAMYYAGTAHMIDASLVKALALPLPGSTLYLDLVIISSSCEQWMRKVCRLAASLAAILAVTLNLWNFVTADTSFPQTGQVQ